MACKASGENGLIERREMAAERERQRMANLLDSWDNNSKQLHNKRGCLAITSSYSVNPLAHNSNQFIKDLKLIGSSRWYAYPIMDLERNKRGKITY